MVRCNDMINLADLNKARPERDSTLYLVLSGDKGFKPSSSLMMEVGGVSQLVSGMDIYNALVHRLVDKRLADGYSLEIYCGTNTGTDLLAQEWAKRNNYRHHVYSPNWDKIGASAMYQCCEDIYLHVGIKKHKGCLLLWDGDDKMTRYMMYCSWQQDVPCRVWNYIKKTWLSQEEILDIQMEVRREQLSYGRC